MQNENILNGESWLIAPAEYPYQFTITENRASEEKRLPICSIPADNINEDAEAIAKLIAATPLLLEALKGMVKLYEEVQPAGGWQGFYDESRYAIKQATT